MGKLEQIKLEYEKALGIANKLYNELTSTPDGYLYKVIINSYGSRSACDYINQYPVDSLVSEYGDGYDGLLNIYSNNPRLIHKVGKDTGRCDTYYTLEELPEEKSKKYAGNPFNAGINSVLETMLK